MVLRKTAALYGLDCSYERFEFSALSGDAGMWHLTLTPKEGGEPVLQSEYVRGHISTWALFRGRLDVWRVEADGVDVNVDRTADGRLPLVDRFLGAGQAKPAATPKVASTGKIDLTRAIEGGGPPPDPRAGAGPRYDVQPADRGPPGPQRPRVGRRLDRPPDAIRGRNGLRPPAGRAADRG